MKSAEMKREEAIERLKVYEQRTVTEQLDIISRRPGKAKKETARLQSKLEAFNFEGMFKESKPKKEKELKKEKTKTKSTKKKGVKKPKVRGVQKSKGRGVQKSKEKVAV